MRLTCLKISNLDNRNALCTEIDRNINKIDKSSIGIFKKTKNESFEILLKYFISYSLPQMSLLYAFYGILSI